MLREKEETNEKGTRGQGQDHTGMRKNCGKEAVNDVTEIEDSKS